jgi:hypothetical protein
VLIYVLAHLLELVITSARNHKCDREVLGDMLITLLVVLFHCVVESTFVTYLFIVA